MKHLVAAVLALLVAAALAAPALADSDGKTTLGPAGYNGPGSKATLVTAGTANVVLDDGDHVVICHAIGGPNGSRFNQIAPSATGVAMGHGGHEADRDIIPPFTLRTKKGTDTSLASGQNWNAANAAVYANGCSAPATPTPPVTPPTTPTPPVTPPTVPAPPATPPTIVIEKVEVHTTTVVVKTVKVKAKAKKVKKVKKVKKAKAKIKVKAAHKVFKPRVLPHTR